jgi:enamine deaminase RidA (YjgF/YER057c/UK114 family)
VFISATPPVDMATGGWCAATSKTQTEASLKVLKHCLEAAGTSLDKVAMCASTPSIPASTAPSIGSMRSILRPNLPARRFVPVASWPMEFDIEIECVAVA